MYPKVSKGATIKLSYNVINKSINSYIIRTLSKVRIVLMRHVRL